jgi:hypothetical protein
MTTQEHGPSQVSAELAELARSRKNWQAVPKRLFNLLLAIDFYILAVFAFFIIIGKADRKWFALFNPGVEPNPPTWYSAVQLFLLALGFLMLASGLLPQRRRVWDLRRMWLVLGLGFTYMSMDEGGQFHERLRPMLLRLHFNVNYHNEKRWVFFYLLIAVVLVFTLRRQILQAWRTMRTESLLFVAGFLTWILGGVGVELLQRTFYWKGHSKLLAMGVEEGLEMIGVTIMVLAVYRLVAYAMSSAPDSELSTPLP